MNEDAEIPSKHRFGDHFPPQSIAVVGVSRKDESHVPGFTGLKIFRGLLEAGFPGRVYPVNPSAREIEGAKAYKSVTDIPETLDLVIVTVPAPVVPHVIDDCAEAKAHYVHICSSGFSETGDDAGRLLEGQVLEKALKGGLKVIGPNCMGFSVPSVKMNMFSNRELLARGSVAFVSQSGGHAATLIESSPPFGFGFSKVISYGNGLMLDAVDFLPYLADDPETRIICMYLEGIRNGRELLRCVKDVNSIKPVIIWKGGLTGSGSRAAASHTGSMGGDKEIWDGFFKQTDAVAVDSLPEMAATAMTFQNLKPATGVRTALLGMGGGSSVANGDICAKEGLELSPFSSRTQEGLSQFISCVNQGLANPMDVPGVISHPRHFNRTLHLLANDPSIDMIVFSISASYMLGTWQTPILKDNLTGFLKGHPVHKPVVVAVSDDRHSCKTEPYIRELREAGLTAFDSLTQACRALRRFAAYHSFLRKAPPE